MSTKAKRPKLKLIQGGGEGGPPPAPSTGVPLAGRPEYEAQMRAWRKHGCPRPY